MARVCIKAEINGKAGDVVFDVSPRVARMLLVLGVGEAVEEKFFSNDHLPGGTQTAAVKPPEQRGASHK